MAQEAIVVENLRKVFGDLVAVDGLSLRVPRGEIFGLVGPDGAGKTTTMRLLCGVLLPDGGTARVAGFDVVENPEAVKQRIGYLPQQFGLYGDLTVAENIAFVADLYNLPPREWQARAEELLAITRLRPFIRRRAAALSGGMQQKLALICSLLTRPEVLFLDEPTTGVDPLSRRDFWAILRSLPAQGVTVFVSTPYMDEAAQCQRLGFLAQGRLLACDTPARLREQLTGRVLELRCIPLRPARTVLEALPQVHHLEVFGNRLHLLVDDAARDAATVVAALEGEKFTVASCRPIEPSLEDVFIALLGIR